MKNPKKDTSGFGVVEILLAIVVLGLIAGAGWYVVNGRDGSQASSKNSGQSRAETPKTKAAEKQTSYEHPVTHYSLQYPANWQLDKDTIDFDNASVGYSYSDFAVRSPDYQEELSGVLTGASVFVRVTDTAETSIEAHFSKEPLAAQIAQSKIQTTVNGQAALQYDYSYENTNATDTVFIKNGKHYLIKLQYPELKDKSQYLPVYQEILDSFKAQ